MRLWRILRDAVSTEGGGGSETPPPAKPPETPPADVVPKSEFEKVSAELIKFREAEKARDKAAKEAADKAARERGDFDKLLGDRETELATTREALAKKEARFRTTLVEGELARVLANTKLVDGAADHLTVLLRGELEAVEAGDAYAVKSRDGKAVAEFVKVKLADPKFAIYLPASSRGGAGGGGSAPAPSGGGDDGNPLSYEEQILANWNARQAASGNGFQPAQGLRPRPRQ